MTVPVERIDGISAARRPRRVPVVLSQGEVRAIVAQLEPPSRLCVVLMYGSGLRLGEAIGLRVKDIDFDRREIVVRGGKGDNDRRTPLAESCCAPLRQSCPPLRWFQSSPAPKDGRCGAGCAP